MEKALNSEALQIFFFQNSNIQEMVAVAMKEMAIDYNRQNIKVQRQYTDCTGM